LKSIEKEAAKTDKALEKFSNDWKYEGPIDRMYHEPPD